MADWYLGSMNDGLFIINTPPRPSTDDQVFGRTDGPSLVLNVTDLPARKAQAIVDAHNAAVNAYSPEREQRVRALVEVLRSAQRYIQHVHGGAQLPLLERIDAALAPFAPPDPRDPDYSKSGVFQTHNCWKCKDGAQPCAN